MRERFLIKVSSLVSYATSFLVAILLTPTISLAGGLVTPDHVTQIVPQVTPRAGFYCADNGKETAWISKEIDAGSSWNTTQTGSNHQYTGRSCNPSNYTAPEVKAGTFCNANNQQIAYYKQDVFHPGTGWNDVTQPHHAMKGYHFNTGESCVLNECVFFDYTGTGDYTEHKMQKFPFGDGSFFGTVTRRIPAENDYVYDYNDCPAGQSGYKKYFKYYNQKIGCVGDSIDRRESGLREASDAPKPVQTELVKNTCSYDEPEPEVCSNEILGNLDSVTQNDDGTLNIQGWSCAKNCESGNNGNTIHVKAREPGTFGPGQYFLRAYQTNTSSSYSNQQCGVNGQHAFNINIPADIWKDYSGKNLLINGEGKIIPYTHETLNGVHRIPEYIEPTVNPGECDYRDYTGPSEYDVKYLALGERVHKKKKGETREVPCPDGNPGERVWWDTYYSHIECHEDGKTRNTGEQFSLLAASFMIDDTCPMNPMELA